MTYVSDTSLSHLATRGRRPSIGIPQHDIVVLLTDTLGPNWSVQRETDCAGDVSIVVMPVIDHPAKPTFILYESGGQAHVGIVRDDEWESTHSFDTMQQAAMVGVIAEINYLIG